MKQIIEGVAYDTDAATYVASGDHGHEMSQASWMFYQTRHGAFFEVVAGHDGVVEEFKSLTDKQARRFLEVNANNLVEKYFGPMAEPHPIRFSRETVIAALEVIERQTTQAELTRALLKWGPDFERRVGGEKNSVTSRINNLIRLVDQNAARRVDTGELLYDVLIEEAVALSLPSPTTPRPAWIPAPQTPPHVEAFRRALRLDGFTVTDGALRRSLTADVGLPEAKDEITRLLQKHKHVTPKGHLDQALDAHADGNWAAANSQIRAFFDALLDEIAERLDARAATLPSGQARRAKLAALGFLSRNLNEWDDNGLGFINGLVKRLHPHGAHPGLSDEEDSTFRLHVILLTARLLLTRFDAQVAS